MAKFGKKNKIKLDVTAYNVGLIGESGIGKTTIMKEALEKLVGEDGYMILNIGLEDGVDALPNASYEDIPDFETLEEFVDYVIENKKEEYPDLKVVVVDTADEIFRIVEPFVVKLHNKEHPDKKVKTIKAAFGGFQAGEEKAIELVLNTLWRLKKEAGISIWWTGHTKRRSVNDIYTGDEYETLTSNMSQKYFNAIKTKLHFLGVASIKRDIEKVKVKQKVGADKVVGKVKDESRVISFRDDNFNIDSKSRFSEIIDSVPLNVESFINALEDAIKVEYEKQGGKSSDIKKEKERQLVEKEEKLEQAKEARDDVDNIDESTNELLLKKITTYVRDEDADEDIVAEIGSLFKATGYKTSATDLIPTSVYRKAVALFE